MIPKMKADTGMGMKMYRREATNLLAMIGSVFFGNPFLVGFKGKPKGIPPFWWVLLSNDGLRSV